jgi:hypothetical protein
VVTTPPTWGLLPGCGNDGFAFWLWAAANCGCVLVAWGGVDCIFPYGEARFGAEGGCMRWFMSCGFMENGLGGALPGEEGAK